MLQVLPSYVLITPARNEAQFIEATIESVIAQTVRPLRWVIVSDGSTDGTDEIASRYAGQYDWIRFVRMPERADRNFAGKAFAFRAGKSYVEDLHYDVIANLDADVTFRSDYFAFLLEKLDVDPKLGVVGTPYVETSGEIYDFRFTSLDHVSGACQVFRRECFEAIGGYEPVKLGAIDCIAVISARMNGWKTRTFTERVYMHHRRTGTAERGFWRAAFANGAMDYAIGNHPIWQISRVVYQMTRRPYLVRGLAIGLGYLSSVMQRRQHPVSGQFVEFHRREQIMHLQQKLGFKRSPNSEHMVAHEGASQIR